LQQQNKINRMKPTLVILAAGMGSRYGGLKQLDALGPGGETIMDYSVFDSIRAGFGKVVFIIRKDFEDDFRCQVLKKYEGLEVIEAINSVNVDGHYRPQKDIKIIKAYVLEDEQPVEPENQAGTEPVAN
jgi:2-C-methyl-D-erythritol 4-phosphate cytidylyltransferase